MPSETEITIAFLFKRSGKSSLNYSDIYLTLSMDLNWFTPEDAKSFVNLAIEKNLLIKKGDLLEPSFDFEKIVVPTGFAPSKQIFKGKNNKKYNDKSKESLDKIVNHLVNKTDLDNQRLLEKINSIAIEKNITKDVAALLVGKELDVDLNEFFEIIEEKIFT